MNKLTLSVFLLFIGGLFSFKPIENKLISKDTHITFYSHTSLEDISANNYNVVSTLDQASGDVVFSVPMQSFEFEKSLMQKHYNSSSFLDTKKYPKAKFVGKLNDLTAVDFHKNGTYKASATGSLTIKDVTKSVSESGTITVAAGIITLNVKMMIRLADYNITFTKGKPSTNVAKEVEATIVSVYKSE